MKRALLAALATAGGCLGGPLSLGDEPGDASAGEASESATASETATGSESGTADGSTGAVDCEMDMDPPVLAEAYPADAQTGIDPDATFSFLIEDPCGVDPGSISLQIDAMPVVPAIGGDAEATTVEWTPPGGTFALDQIAAASLHAADLAGNPLDVAIDFRIWDDFQLFVPTFGGIAETAPNVPPTPAPSYLVRESPGDAARVVARAAAATEPPGTIVVDARLRLASDQSPAIATAVACHALAVSFDPVQVTWNSRAIGMPWAEPGADAVPADRDGAPMLAVELAPALPAYTEVFADVVPEALAPWLAGAGDGMVCIGDADGVPILGPMSNYPPVFTGHLGRPL